MTKEYAQFNTVSVQGRVFNAEVVDYKGNEFLSVTLITTLEDDGQVITVRFTNNNGLKTLFERGYLPTGRLLTVTGHMSEMTSTYTNKEGEMIQLKYPQLKLKNAVVADGALGPIPSDKKVKTVVNPGQVVRKGVTTVPVEAPPLY